MEKSTLIGIILFLVIIIVGFFYYEVNISSIENPFLTLMGKKTIKLYFEPIDTTPSPLFSDFDYITQNYWEGFRTDNKIDFVLVNSSEEADVHVKWIKEYSDNTLGYTYEGKIVELGYGDSKCDGIWRQYDQFTTEKVFLHELGHVLGKSHSNDSGDIMYYSLDKSYVFEVQDFNIDSDKIGFASGGLNGPCSQILEAKRQGALL